MAASAVAALCGCLAAAGCGKQVDGAEPTLNYAFCMTERSQPQLFLEEKWVLGRRSWNIFARPLERTSKKAGPTAFCSRHPFRFALSHICQGCEPRKRHLGDAPSCLRDRDFIFPAHRAGKPSSMYPRHPFSSFALLVHVLSIGHFVSLSSPSTFAMMFIPLNLLPARF